MWTKEKFLAEVKPDEVFRTVIETVTFITGYPQCLIFVAKRGEVEDWVVYCAKVNSEEIVLTEVKFCVAMGDKVTGEENIKHIVDCDYELLKLYRR